jgi:hypothetical protein
VITVSHCNALSDISCRYTISDHANYPLSLRRLPPARGGADARAHRSYVGLARDTFVQRRRREFGKPTSVWTLDLAAEVSVSEGIVPMRVSGETIRQTLKRLGLRWERAKHADWVLGFFDETLWSRMAQPQLHSWVGVADGPVRLVEQGLPKGDPDPKALACYGAMLLQAARHRGRGSDDRRSGAP